jgi:DNA-binding NarL/FixJ family response regulator
MSISLGRRASSFVDAEHRGRSTLDARQALARRRAVTAIDIVEVAYRSAGAASDRWVEDVLEVAAPMLDRGGRVFAYEYDTTKPYAEWLSRPRVAGEGDHASYADGIMTTFAATPVEINEWVHKRAGAVTVLSELLGMMPGRHEKIGPHATALEVDDMIGINAADPSGRGTYFCTTTSKRLIDRAREDTHRLEQLAAHLAAAGRLRRVLAPRQNPEAVFAPSGEVLHSSRRAEPALSALARSVRAIDRARTRAARTEPEALSSWQALVEGRWSLVDVVESDGRRVLFAMANPPHALDPRRLTPTERAIAGYIAMGHSNKLIAYELGISVGAVSGHTHGILKKLGVRSRVELVDLVTMLQRGATIGVAVDPSLVAVSSVEADAAPLEGLSPAEDEVARMAARGRSNTEIAKSRGVSVRTITNQLASIFAKLGVESRSELSLVVRRGRR